MRHALLVACAVTLGAFCGPAIADEKDADLPDAKRVVGRWKLELKIEKGVETKTDDAEENQLTLRIKFEEQNLKVYLGPKGAPIELSGTYFLDATQTPKLFDVTLSGGDGGTNEVHAIYKFEKDRLFIRLRNGGGQRPIDFETPEDDCQTVVFRRLKDDE